MSSFADGRRKGGRKLPFSGKAKKQQLKEKRERRREQDSDDNEAAGPAAASIARGPAHHISGAQVEREFVLPAPDRGLPPGQDLQGPLGGLKDLRTMFRKETAEEVAKGRADATRPLKYTHDVDADAELEQVPVLRCPPSLADLSEDRHPDFPKRPDWRSGGTQNPQQLEAMETQAYEEWLRSIYDKYPVDELNHFEHNLEVWRQLWRTEERSDILLLLADARLPALHFHARLYRYIKEVKGKDVVLCLNKADLVPQQQAAAWMAFFRRQFPSLPVVYFASSPKFTRVKGTRVVLADPEGAGSARRLLRAIGGCRVRRAGQMVSAEPFIREAIGLMDKREAEAGGGAVGEATDESESEGEDQGEGQRRLEADAAGRNTAQSAPSPAGGEYVDGVGGATQAEDREYIVVGVLGDPNMGKSSLMNTLLGKKKVSTSATPGHTKHMQTHYVCSTFVLCDCPGVTFPQTGVPQPLQVIFGSYPIAQVREPFSVVRYVAENCWPRLHKAFKLDHIARVHAQDFEDVMGVRIGRGERLVWSPYTLAMALAIREGFYTKGKGGRPDVARAANRILRDALNGRGGALLAFWPPEGEDAGAEIEQGLLDLDAPFAAIGMGAGAGANADKETTRRPKKELTKREQRLLEQEQARIAAVESTDSEAGDTAPPHSHTHQAATYTPRSVGSDDSPFASSSEPASPTSSRASVSPRQGLSARSMPAGPGFSVLDSDSDED